MSLTTGKAFLLAAILTSMAISGWYFASDSDEYTLNDEQLQESIDNRASHLLIKKFDPDGHLTQRLYTPQLTHIPKGDQNHFSQPNVVLYSNNDAPWHITSSNGYSHKGGEKIELIGSVVIQQHTSEGVMQRITTEALDYFPQKQYAETNKVVHFKKPGIILKGEGMHAWLVSRNVRLLDNVQGHYAP